MRGLFEGVQYNSEAGAKCAVYSRARTKQGRGVIKEIRYMTLGGFMTFSGLTLVVRLMCRIFFSWNEFHEIHEIHEFHEIAVTFFFFASTVYVPWIPIPPLSWSSYST